MNKKALEDYALFARNELETQIALSLNKLGIYKDRILKANVVGDLTVIEGTQETFPKRVYELRETILNSFKLKDENFEHLVEEFAYTWFNRIIAIRFMEVHDYFDHGFKVLTSSDGSYEPDILKNAHFLIDELNLDVNVIQSLKDQNKIEELYRYILFKQCNALNDILPDLFDKDQSYMELLLPQNLLSNDSVIRKITSIPEEDFMNDVEVVGWLYQYYVASNREEYRKAKTVTKDLIPTLSQIFTPDWIVRYMAENSVGRIWLESYPNSAIKGDMKYYVEDAEQTEDVKKKIDEIKYKNVNPEDIKIIEPCCGSGHILVYIFELLFKMYKEKSYNEKDIPGFILKNNLYGLDIDKRAAQLAKFSLIMKARSIDSRFFNKNRFVKPRVFEIVDSTVLLETDYKKHMKNLHFSNESIEITEYLVETFRYAKTIGSLLKVENKNYSAILDDIKRCEKNELPDVFENDFFVFGLKELKYLIVLASTMCRKYDVMITNPPYLGSSKMEINAKNYFVDEYPNSKSDMFAMFMEAPYCKKNGFISMVNPDSWMFLVSFESLRKSIILKQSIVNMLHLGLGSFDATVQTTTFVIRNADVAGNGVYFRLVDEKDKEAAFLAGGGIIMNLSVYETIPTNLFAYWLSGNTIKNFVRGKCLSEYADARNGFTTGNNDLFLRIWSEIENENICFNATDMIFALYTGKKWFPYNKGGEYHKWYGNQDYVINWMLDGKEIKKYGHLVPRSLTYMFFESISWSKISSGSISFRYFPKGFMFDVAGLGLFIKDEYNQLEKYIMGFLNSNVSQHYLRAMSPTLNYETGQISNLPIVLDDLNSVKEIVVENIEICKKEWNEYETSWNFKKHPLV